MSTNPYEPPKEVSKPRRTKAISALVATIAARTLIGLTIGIVIGCTGILLLPTHSADKRTVYDWTFLALVTVFAGIVIGLIAGIARVAKDVRNPEPTVSRKTGRYPDSLFIDNERRIG